MKQWISFVVAVGSMTLLPFVLLANESSPDVSASSSYKLNTEPFFTPKELEWLEKKIPLTYVYDPDWAPFEWKNGIDQHTGIIADILSLISQKAGIEFTAVNTDTWKESVELVESGKVDMFSAITKNSAREEYLDFTSRDIYSYPAVFITNFDDKNVYLDIEKDLKRKKIGIVKGSGLGQYIKDRYPDLEYIDIPATNDGFSFIRNNKIDLFAINTVTAKYYIEKKGFSDVKIALKLDYLYHLKMAIRKGMPSEIISIIDKSLGNIRGEELNDIFNKWTEVAVEKQTDWKLLIQITGVLFVVILFLIWSNRRLNLRVEARTKELSGANIELAKALELTRQANNAKSLFLASVSHEIRTPMNGVLGMIQVLRGTDLNEEQKLYIETLDSSGNLLLQLIDDLLDLSKIESGKLVLDIEPFDTFNWITDIQNLSEPLFENSKVIFTTEVSKNLPVYLEGDVVRLLQIVGNLVSNAEKYTPSGEVKLTIGGQLINEGQFNLYCSVEDTGVGIADDKLKQIFEAFYQLESERTINKGVGLGLAICKRLTDLMSGNLQVTSDLDKGSCFTFSTILSVPKENHGLGDTGATFKLNSELSILVVDDNSINRLAARALLEQEGHKVVEAENGKIAIEKIKSHLFDVILMDIHMPVMDGVSTTRLIREGDTTAKQTPVIGVSASVMKDEKKRYLEAGMNAVVAKPIIIEKLNQVIQKILQGNQTLFF